MTMYVRDLAAQRQFHIGAAVNTGAFVGGETTYCDVLQREFNVLVAENMMKFGQLSPAPDTYNWTTTDKLIDFAEANNMKVRGHTLVWHQQLPRWLSSGTWTSEAVRLSMTEMDVRIATPPEAAQLASQAESYRDAVELALEHCVALVTWGFSDRYSWNPSRLWGCPALRRGVRAKARL